VNETLRWSNDALELLDQRLLPTEVLYRRYETAESVADAIREMVVRGAPAIGCAAAYGVALDALRLRESDWDGFTSGIDVAIATLGASRPTAVNLFWALARMRRTLDATPHQDVQRAVELLVAEGHAVFEEDVAQNRAIGEHGAQLLSDGARVLTHCNAGSLATAGHGTALGVLRSAASSGKKISVIAGETRPYLQGARLTAWELVQEGIPVTLITDSTAGHLMSRGEIDAVIVGADRVAANGDVANKIGTYTLAVLASRHGIPFYVACPLSTLDIGIPSGESIPIEERPAEEVTGYRETRWAAEGVQVRNPAFDVTPAALVTALITERGVIYRPDSTSILSLFT
jgi:methylthioribose-1-phosphate isomerase